MAEFDFSKLKALQSNIDFSHINITPPQYGISQSVMDDLNRRNQEMLDSIAEVREERDAEELRRHNEIVAALKAAGEKGATVVIGDNATGIQIQQNSAGASQTLTNTVGLDYEQALKVLKEIREYFDFPKFQETFGDNTENVKSIIESTIDALSCKEDERLIKKSLHVLKDLVIGASGSLIASGILALLGTLPIG